MKALLSIFALAIGLAFTVPAFAADVVARRLAACGMPRPVSARKRCKNVPATCTAKLSSVHWCGSLLQSSLFSGSVPFRLQPPVAFGAIAVQHGHDPCPVVSLPEPRLRPQPGLF